MYAITKQFRFSAAHQLHGLPDDHPCSRLHGHNYVLEIELRALELDATGFVVDYGKLAFVQQFIDDKVDHRNLNEFFDQPSAENIAERFFGIIRDRLIEEAIPPDWLYAVRVKETESTCAEYSQPFFER